MPYLQLDVSQAFAVKDKKRVAAAMSATYSSMMSVDIRRISVAIRELGEGGVWRIPDIGSEPVPVAVMMLDIRRGRPAELRMEVAKALCRHCKDILGLPEDRLNVEVTQHEGDEMYHPDTWRIQPRLGAWRELTIGKMPAIGQEESSADLSTIHDRARIPRKAHRSGFASQTILVSSFWEFCHGRFWNHRRGHHG